MESKEMQKKANQNEMEKKCGGNWLQIKEKQKKKKIAWCTILELPCEHRLIYMDDEWICINICEMPN